MLKSTLLKFVARWTAIVTVVLAIAPDAPAAGVTSAPELFASLGPVAPDAGQSLRAAEGWHKDAVVYHVWIAAFRDSDGDGVGDLRGIIQSLDMLRDLGVSALWLSPFFENASSQRNLHGYDVVDHHRVDPRFGTNEDADALIREAHARGLRLIFDFVPNHLSSRHPWFIESRDPSSPKRDWFLWRDKPLPGAWTGLNDRSDWHPFDSAFYYGIFSSGMPDLNHRNPDARLALARAARHWLDRGFDGMRMDAVRYLYENLDGAGVKADQEDQPETIDPDSLWQWHRRLIQLRHDHASLRRGKARFLETDAGPEVLAFWREADGDRTLTLLGASATPWPDITVHLPSDVPGRPNIWLLGEGPVPVREGRTLKIGPLAPFESKVLRWGDQPMPAHHDE